MFWNAAFRFPELKPFKSTLNAVYHLFCRFHSCSINSLPLIYESAIETVDLGSILGRVKPKTVEVGFCCFRARQKRTV